APSPMLTMAMTAPTPMMMPRAVRIDRILLRRSARRATKTVEKKRMGLVDELGGGLGLGQALQLDFREGAVLDGDVVDQLAVAQDEVALAEAGHVELVRDHQDGDALLVEPLEDAHDLDGSLAVEI